MSGASASGETAARSLVAVYADESCLGNGREGDNPGGAGALVEYMRPESTEIVRRDVWVSEPATTNNRMALRSVIETFRMLSRKGKRFSVVFTSDSRYLVDGMTVVGTRLGETRVDAEERPDREPRAVARGGRCRERTRGAVAVGARTPRAPAERVREPPRDVGRGEADVTPTDSFPRSSISGSHHNASVAQCACRWMAFPQHRVVQAGGAVTGGLDRASLELDPLGIPPTMLKFIFVLVVGISIGYFYGFDDAKKNDENVVERVVDRVRWQQSRQVPRRTSTSRWSPPSVADARGVRSAGSWPAGSTALDTGRRFQKMERRPVFVCTSEVGASRRLRRSCLSPTRSPLFLAWTNSTACTDGSCRTFARAFPI